MSPDVLADLRKFIAMVEMLVKDKPDISGSEVLISLNVAAEAMNDRVTASMRPCKNCGHPVAVPVADDRLMHFMPSGAVSNRGCRAASWQRRQEQGLNGHDETLAAEMWADVAREKRRR